MLAVVIVQMEFRNLRADGQNIRRKLLAFQFGHGPSMNGLRFGGNVLGNRLLALGENFAKRAKVTRRSRFFESAPFHS